jgi:RNA polymerase sigma factor (sigma-70 family)
MSYPRQTPDKDLSDARLAQAARHGEMDGLGRLFEKYRPRLYASALSLLGYKADAEDAVHDTFLTALTGMERLRDPAAVGGWLYAILRNRCLTELRRRRPHASSEEAHLRLPDLPDEARVEQQIENRELRDWVWRALGDLPGEQRLTVMLRYFGSFNSYDEVAAILGVPVGTVRSRLADAKSKLADRLLAAAGREEDETSRLTAAREAFYRQAFHQVYRGGRDEFLAHFAPELRFVANGLPTRVGRRFLEAEIDEDLRVGVTMHPQRIMASGELTIIEAEFRNPPEDPFHCPPGAVLALFERDGRVARVHLYLAPRRPYPHG